MVHQNKIALAVACDLGNVIGNKGEIPWQGKVRSDMKRFRTITQGHSVVMGRKTWESIPLKFRPLPLRQNIVITRNLDFRVDDPQVIIIHSLEEAIEKAKSVKMFVIGGAEIYKLALPIADEIYLTVIQDRFEGDAKFPILIYDEWKILTTEVKPSDGEGDLYTSTFWHLERK